MHVPYADVSWRKLRFSLVSGSVDLTALNPISTKVVSTVVGERRLTVTFGILGASHFMSLADESSGTTLLTEVFACAEAEALSSRLHSGPLGTDGRIDEFTQQMDRAAIRYSFHARTEQWDESSGRTVSQIAERIASAGTDNAGKLTGLSFEFPYAEQSNASKQRPVTLVLLEPALGQTVKLTTVHSYPNDLVVVFTESKINGLKKGESQ